MWLAMNPMNKDYKVNSTLIMSCGTVDLLWSWHDNIVTNGLSNCVHMKDGSLELKPLTHT